MKYKYLLLVFLLIILISCSPQEEPDLQATIDVLNTREAESPDKEEITEITNTSIPTDTPVPTDTTVPTSTPTSEPTQDSSLVKAKNFVASEEQNGVLIEVERILICDKTWQDLNNIYSEISLLDDKITFVEFFFRVTNNTNEVIGFNFYTSIASANGEQISIEEYIWEGMGWMGDDLDNDILPGSTVSGGVWGGIKRSSWDEVEKIIISIPEAFDKDYRAVTQDFLFEVEVGDWGFEPLVED